MVRHTTVYTNKLLVELGDIIMTEMASLCTRDIGAHIICDCTMYKKHSFHISAESLWHTENAIYRHCFGGESDLTVLIS